MENLPAPEKRRGRLVLVPIPAEGHITPMLHLATLLHSKGFSITIAHPVYNSPNPSDHPDFDFRPLRDNLSDSDEWTAITFLESVNSDCKEPFHEILMEQKDSGDRIVGIIHDNHMYFPVPEAEALKVPSVIFHTSAASYVRGYLAIPRLNEDGYFPLQGTHFYLN